MTVDRGETSGGHGAGGYGLSVGSFTTKGDGDGSIVFSKQVRRSRRVGCVRCATYGDGSWHLRVNVVIRSRRAGEIEGENGPVALLFNN